VERVAKPVTLLALIAVAVVTPAASQSVRIPLIVALVAGLCGDVLLLPPGRLVPGLVAFLVGHLAYVVAFLSLPGTIAWLLLGIAIAALVAVTVGLRLVRAARPAGLHLPVGAYLLVISLMAVVATRTGILAAIVGAWLFVASDSMLGWAEFVVDKSADGRSRGGPRLRLGVITSYHAAQVLLVLALLLGAPSG
jgi:uncharacterized membrane protein YhhN